MGMIARLLSAVFGDGRNIVVETAEVFREHADRGAERDVRTRDAALAQLGAEFARTSRGRFDRLVDGLNRLPRPALALGVLGLFVSAMVDPVWFAARMQGIALVPEPLWWLLGVIVSFYFGARHQWKAQEFQRELAGGLARAPEVARNVALLDAIRADAAEDAPDIPAAPAEIAEANPALEEWRRIRAG